MTLSKTVAELRPCPFCGGIDTPVPIKGHQGLYRVECCRTVSRRSCGVRTMVYDERAEAIAAWNTRAPESTIEADQARLAAGAKLRRRIAAARMLLGMSQLQIRCADRDGEWSISGLFHDLEAALANLTPPSPHPIAGDKLKGDV